MGARREVLMAPLPFFLSCLILSVHIRCPLVVTFQLFVLFIKEVMVINLSECDHCLSLTSNRPATYTYIQFSSSLNTLTQFLSVPL